MGAGGPTRLIELHNVVRRFPQSDRPVLDGVSLKLERGEFAFLTGASGAGKSTLLRLLYGADQANSGAVRVAGHDVDQLSPHSLALLRRRVAVIFQDFRLLNGRSAVENVRLVLELRGYRFADADRRASEALDQVGLAGKEYQMIPELSGGEQQRVAIARALVGEPQVLLCDEPTGNLDDDLSLNVLSLIDLASARGATVLVATHARELLKRFPHPSYKLLDGRLEQGL
ncbi:MAG: cell division ATP-binding protein FtsE [Myxococcales bacterium]|nr:cell division ATP-binding protein FtsE [Myxococcales bacterium]